MTLERALLVHPDNMKALDLVDLIMSAGYAVIWRTTISGAKEALDNLPNLILVHDSMIKKENGVLEKKAARFNMQLTIFSSIENLKQLLEKRATKSPEETESVS